MIIPYNPISTAPTDGTAILTDKGVAMYREEWLACEVDGQPFSFLDCYGGDYQYISVDPRAWIHLPTWKLE